MDFTWAFFDDEKVLPRILFWTPFWGDSIAAKTATYVMNTLEITKKTTEINDEKEQKKNAAQLQQNIIKQGLKGAMITAREAQVIVTFIRNYQANIKSTSY